LVKRRGQAVLLNIPDGADGWPQQDAPPLGPKALRKRLAEFREFEFGKARVHEKDDQLSNAEKDGLCIGPYRKVDWRF
jgi:hypothetical protein